MAIATAQKQVNIRVRSTLYTALETIAVQEHRSVPQAARILLEEGLRRRIGRTVQDDDTPATAIGVLAMAGGAMDWLADEPDIYDDTCGEPV